ncbi:MULTISPECIES: hypothetical protein [unclassified Streptomyces]|uniref:hypothetical protein n=1 Tax=unclassified Streptomyces TaxID=2593676 RepID=UPI002E31DFAB|nr:MULTISPECIES: hypothetical protein [unclassified Streptomyces]WUC65100.1 hypothetical protein OG861_13080 [Streptomyces sp. NBC_00539]
MNADNGKDLEMDPVAVKNITAGLRGAIAELREFAPDAGATVGAGLEKLTLTGMEAGHPDVTAVFHDLCTRWDWGVRALVEEVSGLTAALNISAGMIWEEDQYRRGTFKVAANSVIGNPHADEDTAERTSWDEIKAPFRHETPEEAQKARDEFGQQWEQAKRDAVTKGNSARLLDGAADLGQLDPSALALVRERAHQAEHDAPQQGER